MLLLVLILVLIAFGLLAVALLSGSVLWAWVSVAVSVAAAGVLLADWWQRRSAERAGTDAAFDGARARPAVPAMSDPAMTDIEPVTELLPVIPPAGSAPVDPAGGGVNGTLRDQPDPGVDPAADNQQTVLIRVVEPSGSPVRPPGAETSITQSSPISSQSVAEGVAVTPAAILPTGDSGSAERPSGTPAEDTAAAPGGASTAVARAGTGSTGTAERARDAVDGPSSPGSDDPAEPDDAGPEAAGPEAVEPTGRETAGSTAAPPGVSAPAAADPESTVAVGSTAPAPDPTDVAAADPAARSVSDAEPRELFGEAPRQQQPPVRQDQAGTAELLPADDEGPPEEPRDAAAAALVAELDDEVVVIDEQPRYHLSGCTSLRAQPLIPLPVREAVELGFTPCGWCVPDATLATRHPAAAR